MSAAAVDRCSDIFMHHLKIGRDHSRSKYRSAMVESAVFGRAGRGA